MIGASVTACKRVVRGGSPRCAWRLRTGHGARRLPVLPAAAAGAVHVAAVGAGGGGHRARGRAVDPGTLLHRVGAAWTMSDADGRTSVAVSGMHRDGLSRVTGRGCPSCCGRRAPRGPTRPWRRSVSCWTRVAPRRRARPLPLRWAVCSRSSRHCSARCCRSAAQRVDRTAADQTGRHCLSLRGRWPGCRPRIKCAGADIGSQGGWLAVGSSAALLL